MRQLVLLLAAGSVGCTTPAVAPDPALAAAATEQVNADELLERFGGYLNDRERAGSGRVHATDVTAIPPAEGFRVVPVAEQGCPVSPPAGPDLALQDVVLTPGRLACTWQVADHELTLTVLLDADLEPASPHGVGVLPTSSGFAWADEAGTHVWVQDTDATRRLVARLTPRPTAASGVPPPDLELVRWVRSLDPSDTADAGAATPRGDPRW